MSEKDISKLQHVYIDGPLHFYYETAADGTRTLRHIRVNQRTYNVPADGVTIDTIPPNSVGSEEIKDGSVKAEDLDIDLVTTPEEARGIVANAIAKADGTSKTE